MSELIERANRLEKLAKAARDREGDQAEIERLKLAIDKLDSAVSALETELKTRVALDPLQAQGRGDVKVDMPWNELKIYVETRGRPTPQRVQGATRRVNEQIEVLQTESQGRWSEWSAKEVADLPRHKVTALSPDERARVGAILRDLDDAIRKAARTVPTADAIRIFRFQTQRVREELGQINLDESVLRVLEKFKSPDGIALLEISDTELDVLRSNQSIATQFVIRRQV